MSVDKNNPDQKVKVSGFIDRVESEIDNEKRLHIIDFKTSKYTLTKEQADEDPQLGVYRLAVTQKSLKADVEPESVDAGASLVYLKHLQKNGLKELPTASIEENGILEILKESFRKI
ncbi:MAG: PD-(D/E)XK nuclease family protein, partial [Actinomycetota bacterium]|nr:PD-(D/E)XK nuclease family protein [Actinomycetota bacterium]